MKLFELRVPLAVQIGVVVALFAASVTVIWFTGAEAVERESRRETAKEVLDRAGDALARLGSPELAAAPDWPYTLSQDEWDELDRRLAERANAALTTYGGVEGGYYMRSSIARYLGHAFPTDTAAQQPSAESGPTHRPSDPPANELNVIQSQVDAALDKNQALYVVVDVPPGTVAVRTAPVWVEGRLVAATWAMTRLRDPLFLERSVRGYRLSAALALCGIALALVLTIGLARTVRRQAAERERLQAELRRSERLAALGKLLAGVAHEVRNPLAGIRSTAQLWQRGLGPDAESIADLEAEVDRLDGIVSRLLQFSRADAHDHSPGDLNPVVAEAARLVRPAADEQGVRVELDLDPSLPRLPMSPPALLQVLRNLTSNALSVMPLGGCLRLATRFDRALGQVEVRVSDTGPGLAPDVREHLFEPFYTTRPDGTGLGLAIAREIALAHRGELHGENQPDGLPGAVFSLTLPVS